MQVNSQLQFSIENNKPNASYLLSRELISLMQSTIVNNSQIVIVCIGTDRSTGDCLGPLVGYKLSHNYINNYAHVMGTLKEPVHAKNLNEKINCLYNSFNEPYIIAIDASLGKTENIGKINLYNGPLFPGSGVNKNLPPIGNISITGIVNISGFMEYLVLQNTRLSLVMEMSDTISLGIYMSLNIIKRSQRVLI